MRSSLPLDRVADQIVGGASETSDVVTEVLADVADTAADVLSDAAGTAMDVVAEGGEALAALSLVRLLKRPKVLVVALIAIALGAWVYRRYMGSDDSVDEAIEDVPSLQR